MFWRHCPCFRRSDDTWEDEGQQNAKVLDYSHSNLEDVPSEVFQKERTLEELYLDSNQIRDLPRALFHCSGLRKLSLSDNEIQSLPVAVSSLTSLEELILSKNGVLEIPETLKGCKCLRTIDASVNPLGRLPEGFTQLINLQELYLNDTFLEYLPANFGRLVRLQVVELRENHLKMLPKSMARLTELRRLDIGQNDLMELPEVIGSLPKLSELWCDYNRLISIPEHIGNLKELTYFDASNNRIEEVAPDIGFCELLTDLTLSVNKIQEIPETVGKLKNLTMLRLDTNDLICLPSTIGSLTCLEELAVNENCIEYLPPSIGYLRNLQTLIADANCLKQLPPSLGSCLKLRLLSLAENDLSEIPEEIGRLSRLKVLNLSSNRLKSLPFSLTKMTQLQALWLSDNQQKPIMKLQTDTDHRTGRKILTCFLLPQQSLDDMDPPFDPCDEQVTERPQSSDDKQVITFSGESTAKAEEDETHIGSKLIRAPTPYPKELKAHARHARNLALKQKDAIHTGSKPDITESAPKSQGICSVLPSESQITTDIREAQSSHIDVNEGSASKNPPTTSVKQQIAGNVVFQDKLMRQLAQTEYQNSRGNLIESRFSAQAAQKDDAAAAAELLKQSIGGYKPTSGPMGWRNPFAHRSQDDERGYVSDQEMFLNNRNFDEAKLSSGYASDVENVRKNVAKGPSGPTDHIHTKENGMKHNNGLLVDGNPRSRYTMYCQEEGMSPLLEKSFREHSMIVNLGDLSQSESLGETGRFSYCQPPILSGLLESHPEDNDSARGKDAVSLSSVTSIYPSSESDRAKSSRRSSYSSSSQHSCVFPNEPGLPQGVVPPPPPPSFFPITTQPSCFGPPLNKPNSGARMVLQSAPSPSHYTQVFPRFPQVNAPPGVYSASKSSS